MYQRQILSEKNFASSASIHVGAIVSYPSKALSFLGQQGWTLSCHFLFSLVLLGLMNNTKLKEKLIIVVLRVNRKLFIFYCSIICLLFLLPPAPELLNTFTFQNVKHYMFSSLLNSCFHYQVTCLISGVRNRRTGLQLGCVGRGSHIAEATIWLLLSINEISNIRCLIKYFV